MRIGILDYGMGNIYSLKSAISAVTPQVNLIYSNKRQELHACDKFILPGVGNFKLATTKLEQLGLKEIIHEEVTISGKPILGICLGMQLLFESSEEGGFSEGLGLCKGHVERFDKNINLKIPHIGFNNIEPHKKDTVLLKGAVHLDYYFIHTFRTKNPDPEWNAYATCTYGETFVALVERENVFGTQFHPEKSQTNGLKLLENFIKA